jgi:hypothetical protein
VALARAIRADTEVDGHPHEGDYPNWIRHVADKLTPRS